MNEGKKHEINKSNNPHTSQICLKQMISLLHGIDINGILYMPLIHIFEQFHNENQNDCSSRDTNTQYNTSRYYLIFIVITEILLKRSSE